MRTPDDADRLASYPFNITPALAAKVGSILVHVEEAAGPAVAGLRITTAAGAAVNPTDVVRAVLYAIRDPDEAIRLAVEGIIYPKTDGDNVFDRGPAAWRAGIDAILAEKPE